MASNYSFSVMPSVSISRSRFQRNSQHKTSFNLGYIVPIYVDEVLPGDTRSIDLAALVRMSTPIAPIMDNIYLDFFAFFVPNRLVWQNWQAFCGESKSSAGIPSTPASIPVVKFPTSKDTSKYVGSLASYFGLPLECWEAHSLGIGPNVSALPFRGYYLIYNEWFRNQNIIAPVPVLTDNTVGAVVSRNIHGTTYANDMYLPCMKASKLPDYFTKALPYAQKSEPIQIPMGMAPVVPGADHTFATAETSYRFLTESGGIGEFEVINGTLLGDSTDGMQVYSEKPSGEGTSWTVKGSNLVADVKRVAGTIDELRYAFQLQKFLYKDGVFGSRYWEILAGHFNIKAPDASLQRPEYLGGHRMNINIDQVLSTAGYSNTSSTTVGAPGANSVTGKKVSLFTKSFTEHGYIFIMAVARHDQTYTAGINRMWLRRDRFDFYWPEFANLGSQAVLFDEIQYLKNDHTRNDVFGYQEAWAEYRYKPSMATGLLNPTAPNALDYWTLSNAYSNLSPVELSQSFIEEDRTSLGRALVTSTTGPDFIGDFYFRDIAVRPMPTYSIPGLADHH